MTFSVTILGSSSALPTPERFSTAQVINVLERFFLIDCGEGTQIQLRRFKIKSSRINHIFISHLHGDHFLGIFGLISTMNMLDRKLPLHIHGPYKLEALINAFIETMDKGIKYDIVFHALEYSGKNIIFEDDKVKVESFPLRHRVPTCGFLISEKPRLRNLRGEAIKELKIPIRNLQFIKEGNDYISETGEIIPNSQLTHDPHKLRSYAFVSDSAKNPTIVPYIKNVDLLYHEATYAEADKKLAKATGHSTARQAAEIAQKANAGKLILGHFSNRYKNLEILTEQAGEIFKPTELATDGKLFEIKW